MVIFSLAYGLSVAFTCAWCLLAPLRHALNGLPALAERAYQEIHPLVPYMIVVTALYGALVDHDIPAVDGLLFILWWFYNKKHDNDRWRRRRKKLIEKVKESAGKLVVVPQSQGA